VKASAPPTLAELLKRSPAVARRSLLTLFVVAVTMMAVRPTLAGEYSVSPLRIDLDRDARSGVVTLANSGNTPLDFQISVLEWTQEAEGPDRYSPTDEIVFFPKIMTVRPGESRVVRVGTQASPPTVERTFRLFVEPLPQRSSEPLPSGANVAISVRFALPVFVKPARPAAAAEIDGATVRTGTLAFTFRNTGNVHVRLDEGIAVVGRDAQGRQVFSQRIESRYVLARMSRPLSLALPKDACREIATLELTARAEQLTASRRLDLSRADCE
jgi:fimbrial chaperone protein